MGRDYLESEEVQVSVKKNEKKVSKPEPLEPDNNIGWRNVQNWRTQQAQRDFKSSQARLRYARASIVVHQFRRFSLFWEVSIPYANNNTD